jgi:hypothetical protein
MISDSLTFNPNPLPPENNSVFKQFILSQDELGGLNPNIYHYEISKDKKEFIVQKSFVNDSALCTSMFFQKSQRSFDLNSELRNNYSSDWIFLTFLISLVFAVIFSFKNNKRISQLFKAFLAPHFTNQLIREGNIMREFFIYPLLLLYFTSFSLLICKLLNIFINYEVGIYQGLMVFLAVVLFFLFKIIIINILGAVFHTKKETFEYLTNYIIFSIVFGVFLFPFVFFLIYITPLFSAWLTYIILVVFGLIYFYRTIRGFIIGLNSERYNLYYLFLYLCTVEILPLSISVKLLINFYLTGDFLK